MNTLAVNAAFAGVYIPRAAEIDAPSFNRVGNAPRVKRRGTRFRDSTRGALPTRLNESIQAVRGIPRAVSDEASAGWRQPPAWKPLNLYRVRDNS